MKLLFLFFSIILLLSSFLFSLSDTEILLMKKYFTKEDVEKFINLHKSLLEVKEYYDKGKYESELPQEEKNKNYLVYYKLYSQYQPLIDEFIIKCDSISANIIQSQYNLLNNYYKQLNNVSTKKDEEIILKKIKEIQKKNKIIELELEKLLTIIDSNTYKLFDLGIIEGKWVNGKLVFKEPEERIKKEREARDKRIAKYMEEDKKNKLFSSAKDFFQIIKIYPKILLIFFSRIFSSIFFIGLIYAIIFVIIFRKKQKKILFKRIIIKYVFISFILTAGFVLYIIGMQILFYFRIIKYESIFLTVFQYFVFILFNLILNFLLLYKIFKNNSY